MYDYAHEQNMCKLNGTKRRNPVVIEVIEEDKESVNTKAEKWIQ